MQSMIFSLHSNVVELIVLRITETPGGGGQISDCLITSRFLIPAASPYLEDVVFVMVRVISTTLAALTNSHSLPGITSFS